MNNVSLQSVGRRISVGASNCCLFDSIRLILPGSLVQMLIANCPRADRVSAWTMVEIGMGVSYGIGTRVFVQQRLSSPTPPPPSLSAHHLSCSEHLGSCHLIQLITDWDGLWETRQVAGFAQARHTRTLPSVYPGIYNTRRACKEVSQKVRRCRWDTCSSSH